MIRICLLVFTLFLFHVCVLSQAQPSFIEPYRITVSSSRTTHLVFPFPVKSIDRGNSDILAQKSPGTDAVLQVKADHPRIAQTNLTVITVNNRLYSFLVSYDSMPQHLTLVFDSAGTGYKNVIQLDNSRKDSGLSPDLANTDEMPALARGVERKKRNRIHLQTSHDRLHVYLTGIYTKYDRYYFLFRLRNRSNISYSLGSISFTIRDAKRVKRMASQEKMVPVLYQLHTDKAIPGPGRGSWVLVTSKFTLEDRKLLDIQILEEEGGRNISFQINNRILLSAGKL
ncbi:MAG: conjugative transposon protein TraN [Williamsia sp.]|nr:conjugative transposon protein TraN [Williamsia sp.]